MYLSKRISARWSQFRGEVSGLIAGFYLLIVNLAYVGQLRGGAGKRMVVIVDSWREAMILRLLWVGRALPRCKIWVVRHSGQLDSYAKADFEGESLLVATSRVYTKHYQLLAALRRQQRLIVF